MTKELDPKDLRKRVDPALFEFETTLDLPPLQKPLGQKRALDAMNFGLEIESHGFNLFVLGQPGAGKQTTASLVVGEIAKKRPVPPDLVYVYNFDDAERPVAIELPSGMGEVFRQDVKVFIAALLLEIPTVFATEAYAHERSKLFESYQSRKNEVLKSLETLANEHNFQVNRSAEGLALIYTREGEPVPPEELKDMSAEENTKLHKAREVLQVQLHKTIRELKELDRENHETITALDNRIGLTAVGNEIDALEEKYASIARVVEYLNALKNDILQSIDTLRAEPQETPNLPFLMGTVEGPEDLTKRYQVNLLVNNAELKCAPVIFESNPTYHNLMGRIDHCVQQYGAFVTDYTMLKAGAFHRANGGYLVLNARELLLNPFAYEALKRVLKDQQIQMEEIGEQMRLLSTVSLKPEAVPTKLKVVLLGTPWLYYLLEMNDEDFHKLFKVKGEFAHDMNYDDEGRMGYAYLVANQCAHEGLLPLSRAALAKVVEHGMRVAESQKKLSTHFLETTDLVREANHWATKDNVALVEPRHIIQAVENKIYRNDYMESVIGEMIGEGTILIDVKGAVEGQVNGLSVYDMGDYAFGKPSRVTARVFMGREGLINIERESDLGGRIHNKGVMILQGFFGARYAQRVPMTFGATLCFEQSYGGVEGDSASSAELYSLISALTGVPVRQEIAVTGSVNQMGHIQAIGGVNLKIEGFYKTCKVLGLTGTQGVMIPLSNVPNLMLSDEVVDAVREGQFHIYPISSVDEGLKLLTGMDPGEEDGYGGYPNGTLNARVLARMETINKQWRQFHVE